MHLSSRTPSTNHIGWRKSTNLALECSTNLVSLPGMGNRIAELRERKGLSQEELAEAVGTSGQQIGRLEKGSRKLTTDWMDRLAPALDVRPRDLLGEDQVPVVGYVGAGAEIVSRQSAPASDRTAGPAYAARATPTRFKADADRSYRIPRLLQPYWLT